jgi:hypothetical protein
MLVQGGGSGLDISRVPEGVFFLSFFLFLVSGVLRVVKMLLLMFWVVMPRPYFITTQKTNIDGVTLFASFNFASCRREPGERGK